VKTPGTIKPHFALIGANLIYGLNYSIAKLLMPDYIKPFGLVALRSVVATSLFWILSLFFPNEKVAKKDMLYMLSFFLFGVFFNQVFFLAGLNRTTPINASLIMLVNPIMAIIFGVIILKEKLRARRLAGVLTGLTGTAILILGDSGMKFGGGSAVGDLMIFINATSWALFLVTIKKMTTRYSNVTVMKWVFLFGVTPNLLIGHRALFEVDFTALPAVVMMGMVYVTVFTTFLGYNLNTYGLKYVSPTVVSTYVYMQPVVAVVVAMMIGQDRLTLVKVLSALLVFLGVWLVSTRSAREKIREAKKMTGNEVPKREILVREVPDKR
jgi:drug/metabolite transporter (DMT)-like permease